MPKRYELIGGTTAADICFRETFDDYPDAIDQAKFIVTTKDTSLVYPRVWFAVIMDRGPGGVAARDDRKVIFSQRRHSK